MDAQIVFQNPYSALNPNQLIYDTLDEPLRVNGMRNKAKRRERIVQLLEAVNLRPEYMYRYPHQFSGGQRQRIVIARSLTVDPKFLLCDEPVSALDVSVQTQILNLLKKLQQEFGLTYVFIAHDLSVVEYVSNEVAVMYLGDIVERFPVEALDNCVHPYTQALISSVPRADPKTRSQKKIILYGEVPDPSNPPSGCKFHPRCRYATEVCKNVAPETRPVPGIQEHFVACHHFEKVREQGVIQLK
jgi:oligopeptide/dipeptide ABC transporter ATP-binding protein